MRKYLLTITACLGSALEYYDFVIYALAAHYISEAFFPNADSWISLVQTFSLFAVGYVIRPLGGIIFGSLGDRFSRQLSFSLSMFLMAAATLAIGLLPSYHSIGIAAPLTLCFLRLAQGLAQGAELPGAITLLSEQAHAHKRSRNCAYLFVAVAIGSLSGSLTFYLLSQHLSPVQMHQFGWRIPFIFGALLAIVAYYLRRSNLQLKPIKNPNRTPFRTLIRQFPEQIFHGVNLSLLTAFLVVFYITLPGIFVEKLAYDSHEIYLASTVGMIWTLVCIPTFGYWADQVQRKSLLKLGTIIILVLIYPILHLADLNEFDHLILMFCLYQSGVSLLVATYPVLLAELFPEEVRYTGTALCYNLAYTIAGFLPMCMTLLLPHIQKFGTLALIFIPIAALSLYSQWRYKFG